MTNLDDSILKEFDRQRFNNINISFIMDKLDTFDKKNKFLAFMIDNRNVLLSFSDVIKEVKKYGTS